MSRINKIFLALMLHKLRPLKSASLAIAFLIIAASSSLADTATFTGTTLSGPTWQRPVANFNAPPFALSGNTNVPYSVTQITVGTSGAYAFQSNGINTVNWDNFAVLYHRSQTLMYCCYRSRYDQRRRACSCARTC